MAHALSLTPELVASVDRTAPEVGQEAGQTPLADKEYRRLAHGIVREAGNTLHVFAYGSLIWKSQAGFTPIGMARAHGWRRSFCINLTTWRGTPDQPGLLLALDYGGSCGGILLQADDGIGPDRVEELLRREIDYAEMVPYMRWLAVRHSNEKVSALTFYAAPRGNRYLDLPIEEQAFRIARAAGRAGTCVAYLHNTVVKLIEHGIHDDYLWKLQSLAAEEIRRATA